MYTEDVDLSRLSLAEIESYGLTRAALMLDDARCDLNDKATVVNALDQNMLMWVAIKTLADLPECDLQIEVKDNLSTLCQFVADTTFRHGANITAETLDTLQLINMRISTGFLEGVRGHA